MDSMLVIAVIFVVVLASLAALAGDKKGKRATEKPTKKKLFLTEREQAMHNRLKQSLPDLVVLAQVSFGALLTARSQAARNTFDRKIADFVVCDKALQVLAVIELDDSTHKTKRAKDADRDSMLMGAGYRVLRYPNIPDIDKVRADFMPPPIERPHGLSALNQSLHQSTDPGAHRQPGMQHQPNGRKEPNLEL